MFNISNKIVYFFLFVFRQTEQNRFKPATMIFNLNLKNEINDTDGGCRWLTQKMKNVCRICVYKVIYKSNI